MLYLSDRTEGSKRSPIAIGSIFTSFMLSLTFFIWFDNYPPKLWITTLFFFGFFTGSIHHLVVITTGADLGRSHKKQAAATIIGIIDGIGTMISALF